LGQIKSKARKFQTYNGMDAHLKAVTDTKRNKTHKRSIFNRVLNLFTLHSNKKLPYNLRSLICYSVMRVKNSILK